MNVTAVAITAIICITLLVAQIIAEVAKTKRHTTELAAGIAEREGTQSE
jgi:hypothetical protein